MIHWLVLAGGASSRFGRDKSDALLDGRTLVDHAVHTVQSAEYSSGCTVVGAEYSGGPASAVVSALVRVDAPFVGVLAVDMPFAEQALDSVVAIAESQSSQEEVDAWVPVGPDGRRQWLCAVYRRSALLHAADEFDEWKDAPFHRLVAGLVTMQVPIASGTSLLDIDTPEDYVHAQDIANDLRA